MDRDPKVLMTDPLLSLAPMAATNALAGDLLLLPTATYSVNYVQGAGAGQHRYPSVFEKLLWDNKFASRATM